MLRIHCKNENILANVLELKLVFGQAGVGGCYEFTASVLTLSRSLPGTCNWRYLHPSRSCNLLVETTQCAVKVYGYSVKMASCVTQRYNHKFLHNNKTHVSHVNFELSPTKMRARQMLQR